MDILPTLRRCSSAGLERWIHNPEVDGSSPSIGICLREARRIPLPQAIRAPTARDVVQQDPQRDLQQDLQQRRQKANGVVAQTLPRGSLVPLGRPDAAPADCPWERWRAAGQQAGVTVRGKLRYQVAEALRANSFETPTGTLAFDEKGDLKDFSFVVYNWHQDGTKSEAK